MGTEKVGEGSARPLSISHSVRPLTFRPWLVQSRSNKLAAGLTQGQEISDREAGIFEDADGQPASNVATGVDGNGKSDVPGLVAKSKVAARLAIFHEALGFEKPDQVTRRNLRHPAQSRAGAERSSAMCESTARNQESWSRLKTNECVMARSYPG